MTENNQKTKSSSDTTKRIAQRFLRHENAVLILVLAAIIGVMSLATKGLSTGRANISNTLLQSSNRGVAAVGQAFVILTAGIDVSVGGIGLFSSILGGAIMTEKIGQNILGYSAPIPMAILIMLLVGVAWGSLNGLIISRIGVPPLVVTLGMWEIAKGASYQISRGRSFFELPEGLTFFGRGEVAGVTVPVIFFIVVAATAYFVLNYTTFGKSVYATGGNPVSAWLTGINVKKMRFMVYVISGFLAGVSAIITTGRIMTANMRSAEGLELDSIAAAVVGGVSLAGGKGSILGVVIGAIIIGVINNAMSILGANPALQGVVKGAIIVAAVSVDYIRRR